MGRFKRRKRKERGKLCNFILISAITSFLKEGFTIRKLLINRMRVEIYR